MSEDNILQEAPGNPGMPPRWTSSAKSGVGTACNAISHIWFTLAYGILDEIYCPRLDWACTRDMGFIVTDGKEFFSEERRHTDSVVSYLVDGIPAYHLENISKDKRYCIEKDIIADPARNVILQRVKFIPLQGKLEDYHLYALIAPHLGNRGYQNTGLIGNYKGIPMVFAKREGQALAMACSTAWRQCSVGFVGTSDGWQDLSQHKQMMWHYEQASNGNVALTAEVDLEAANGEFVVAIAIDVRESAAGHLARASLLDGFDGALQRYLKEWREWHQSLASLETTGTDTRNLYRISTAVLRTHEAKEFSGGLIASLSIPWGTAIGDDNLGGYHLVWTRDLVESIAGLLASDAHNAARRVLHYLQATQEADGHWTQNMWLDGQPYWNGIQLDEVGFPVLLTEQAWRSGNLPESELTRLWPMVRQAINYIVCHGPATDQDRWEENAGYSPFTLAVEISALLCAAELADKVNEPDLAQYLRESADIWNECIERLTYTTDTELAKKYGVDGYYVRISPPDVFDPETLRNSQITIRNLPSGEDTFSTVDIVSTDALALVRFGLREANDPRIVNTVKVIDAVLKKETPYGPAWYRYNHDGYGEHDDGSAYDGTGIGRLWPLLVGERAHYELAAGNKDEALRLLHTMEAFANDGGFFSEQIWDAPDIAELGLTFGRPSGSAMPLVWAHAEYIKLLRSLREERVFDMPPYTEKRYLIDKTESPFFMWRFGHKSSHMPAGKRLRIEVQAPAVIRWSADDWKTTQEAQTHTTNLDIHWADLPTHQLKPGSKVVFTFCWTQENRWEGTNFEVTVQ